MIALKLFSGESFGWVLITLGVSADVRVFSFDERFPKLKKSYFRDEAVVEERDV